MAEEPTSGDKLVSGKFVLSIIMWVGPIMLGLISGYGSAKFTSGAIEQKMLNNEAKIAELQRQVELNKAKAELDRDRAVSREELRAYLHAMKDTLEQIQNDVRSLRNR